MDNWFAAAAVPACSPNLKSPTNPPTYHQGTRKCDSTPPRGSYSKYPLSSTSEIKYSDITSKLDGTSLGEMIKIWKDTAASEERINSLKYLSNKKLGLREIEQFSLGLRYNFK